MIDTTVLTRITSARSGDRQALSDLVEPYRAELLVHCYRLIGSAQDAEDMVQETFLRALNHLDGFRGGQYFRAWLYKIATNLCLDALDKRGRRGLSQFNFPAAAPYTAIAPPNTDPIWLEPFPDELLPELTPGPEARYTMRESISLAFLAALQLLPPRQRVVLVLCDVLDWRAREAAQLLDLSLAAVNGLLRRARVTLQKNYPQNKPAPALDHQISPLLNRYVEAWESGDVDTLIGLLADKVIFAMPPRPTWFSGREAVQIHARSMFADPAHHYWHLQPRMVNNQRAFACYRATGRTGPYEGYALQVLTFEGSQITEIHMFLRPLIFQGFGLANAYPTRQPGL